MTTGSSMLVMPLLMPYPTSSEIAAVFSLTVDYARGILKIRL